MWAEAFRFSQSAEPIVVKLLAKSEDVATFAEKSIVFTYIIHHIKTIGPSFRTIIEFRKKRHTWKPTEKTRHINHYSILYIMEKEHSK
jgi:hypothetical protein